MTDIIESMLRLRINTLQFEVAKVIRERDEARRVIVECINRGTDGGASEACSMEFLSYAPNECEAVKRQRDEARRERDEARAALDGRFSSKVFCAMLSTGVCDKIDKSDHEAALTRARIEGRIEGMEKALEEAADLVASHTVAIGRDGVRLEKTVEAPSDLLCKAYAAAIRALKDRAP